MQIPKLIQKGSKQILTVDGKPFVALGGEIHNSDYTSLEYMEGIWKIADDLGMNFLLIPMSWDIVEPEEGKFDFSLAQGLIEQARRWDKKIGFLWFGSWKNAECSYAPAWVKADVKRFKRGQIEKGKNKVGRRIFPNIPDTFPYTTISYLCKEAMEADAKAFAAFMSFLKEFDEGTYTVIAVQVENETGLLGNSREVSDEADAAFASQVPAEFISYMKAHTDTMVDDMKACVENGAESGTWSEVFGENADEIFSAYYVSSFVEYVAKKGKDVYPLPMAVNCWLNKKTESAGSYPSGGPVSRVHEIWNYCAPSIDLYCPDIYVPNFMEVCDEFVRRGTPLFIPEAATHSYSAPRMVYCVGHYHSICYSPFGFDDIGKPFTVQQGYLFGMDTTDPALKTPQSFEEYSRAAYDLRGLMAYITETLGTSDLQAACGEMGPNAAMNFGDITVHATFQTEMEPRNDGYLLGVKVSENEFYFMGNAVGASLTSNSEEKPNVDFALVEEIHFAKDGSAKKGRRLNGDEANSSMSLRKQCVLHVKYVKYE